LSRPHFLLRELPLFRSFRRMSPLLVYPWRSGRRVTSLSFYSRAEWSYIFLLSHRLAFPFFQSFFFFLNESRSFAPISVTLIFTLYFPSPRFSDSAHSRQLIETALIHSNLCLPPDFSTPGMFTPSCWASVSGSIPRISISFPSRLPPLFRFHLSPLPSPSPLPPPPESGGELKNTYISFLLLIMKEQSPGFGRSPIRRDLSKSLSVTIRNGQGDSYFPPLLPFSICLRPFTIGLLRPSRLLGY